LVDNLNGYLPDPKNEKFECVKWISSLFEDDPELARFTICPLDPESIFTWLVIREKVCYGCSEGLDKTLERINRRAPAGIKYYQTFIVVFVLILAYNML
jgi:hypothetical protein